MSARYFLISFLIFASLTLAAEEPDTETNPVTQPASENSNLKNNVIQMEAGLGLTASGSVITSSVDGLKLLEFLVNTGVLYAPTISPLLRYTGPIYKIPPFDLSSKQVGFSYERFTHPNVGLGLAARYTDVTAFVNIPETFFVAPTLGIQLPLIYRVTAPINRRIILASVFQFEGSAAYYLREDKMLSPYGRAIVGVGRGWLAHFGAGPVVLEAHGGVGIGTRLRIDEAMSISAEVNCLGHWLETGSSSFIDRTNVQVNPGAGSIYIVRAVLKAGYHF